MKPLLLSTTLLACAGGLVAGEALPERVPLVFTPATGDHAHAYVQLEGTAEASIPFAMADGKLRIARKGDAWLVDRNGDGKLDDADLPLVNGVGDPFTVPLRLAGGIKPYPLHIVFAQSNWLYLSGGATLDASIGTTHLRLVDRDLNGRFDDLGADGISCGATLDAASTIPLTSIVDIGGQLAHIALIEDGAALSIKPYTGPIAQVTAELFRRSGDPAGVTLLCMDVVLVQDGNLAALHLTRPGTLPAVPGAYQIQQDQLTLGLPPAKGGLGSAIAGALFGKQPAGARTAHLMSREPGSLTLSPGANAFQRGIPDRLSFAATADGEGAVSIDSVFLEDGHGGRWAASLAGADGTLACCAKRGAVEKQLTTMEYG